MAEKTRLIIAVIVLVVLSGAGYLLLSGDGKQAKQEMLGNDSVETSATSAAESQTTGTTLPGAYIDYEDGIIAATPNKKLLFFHAPWCPQCRELDADIKKSGVPDGITVIKVDFDSNQALRKKYGVTLQTTIVYVDDRGEEVKKFVAYDNPTFAAVNSGIFD